MTERLRVARCAVLGSLLGAVPLVLAACKSTPPVREGAARSGGPAADVSSAPEAGGAPAGVPPAPEAGGPAEAAASPVGAPADAGAAEAAREAVPEPSAAARPTVTFRFLNRTGRERYVSYGRYWTDALTIDRRQDGDWAGIEYEQPICSPACPTDGSTPTCAFCSPPAPRPHCTGLRERGSYTWYGAVYESHEISDGRCWCFREAAAPPGRYRVGLCTVARGACQGRGGGSSGPPAPLDPATAGQACVQTEFDLGTEDLTVDVVVAE